MKFTLEKVARKPRGREEANLQVRLMADLDWLLPADAFAFAVPNGGKRDVVEAVNLKRQGVKAGVPDVVIVHKGKALGLELKAEGGRLSDAQCLTFTKLRGAGMRVEVAYSYPHAIQHLKDMGIPLRCKEEGPRAAKELFKQETRRRA